MQYISPYCKDKEALQYFMDRSPELTKASCEIAAEFKLKMNIAKDNRVFFVTNEGYYAGSLARCRSYSAKGEPYFFVFSSDVICKEKNSARSSRHQRDSDKITGIITAMKRNKEYPTTEGIAEKYRNSLRYAFGSIGGRGLPPSINLSDENVVALVEAFLFEKGELVREEPDLSGFHSAMESAYKTYKSKVNKIAEANAGLSRFREGATVIGIVSNGGDEETYYLVGEASYVTDVPVYTKIPVRYNTLADSPVAADAAIIRAYAQGQSWYDSDNELGIPFRDEYFEDIDIAVGYSHGLPRWVVIPKTPNAA